MTKVSSLNVVGVTNEGGVDSRRQMVQENQEIKAPRVIILFRTSLKITQKS